MVKLDSNSYSSGDIENDYEINTRYVALKDCSDNNDIVDDSVDQSGDLESRDQVNPIQSEQSSNNSDLFPGKNINILDNKIDLFLINLKINNELITAVLDSGAAKSLISSDLVAHHGWPVTLENNLFDALGSDTFHTSGSVHCSLSLCNADMAPMEFAVFPSRINNRVQVLLGVDFMLANSLIIDLKNRIISQGNKDTSVVRWKVERSGEVSVLQGENLQCYAAAEVKLTPGEIYKVPVDTQFGYFDNLLGVYTDDGLSEKLSNNVRGYQGILDKDTKFIYMLCSLPTTLRKGDKVGEINTVVNMEPEEDKVNETMIQWEDSIDLNHLSNLNKTRVMDMLLSREKVFSVNESDIGKASVTEHKIVLNDSAPIYQRPRRVRQPINDEIEKQCRELTEADIIEPTTSPWSSPIVPIRKKDGTIRLCVDYRKLNAVTVPDKFPVPNLLDSIFGLGGTKFFTKLDLIRGYYQIPLEESSKQYTAFSTNRGHWQFKRLSFGLRNAPAAFQREIQAVLSAFPSNKVIAYIDDILILSSSFDEHIDLVTKVLTTLETYGIKIKPSKCEWFREEVEFLGHRVSMTGVKKTNEYMKKVNKYPKPDTVGKLREFLGLVNFQRKFIPHCSTLQKPLTRLTGGKSNKILKWTDEMTDSFERLKTEMATELELGYPDYSENANKLELYVDASNFGGGAYLAQQQDGQHRIIGFASMTFTETQLGYATIDRELAALRWGVKTFKPFLYGIDFILFTDHQPLVHLHNMKLVCSRLIRTVQELSEYNFEIQYIPGKLNSAADALSRLNTELPTIPSSSGDLPQGLTYDGPLSPGGADSVFISLKKALTTLELDGLPDTVDGLREMLVEDLLQNSTKYNFKLNRDSRRLLRLMKFPGKLPTLDVLLVACRLFKVKVYVYFWPESPVIYQYQQGDVNVVHLQCLGSVHFNALVEVRPTKLQILLSFQCAQFQVGMKTFRVRVVNWKIG